MISRRTFIAGMGATAAASVLATPAILKEAPLGSSPLTIGRSIPLTTKIREWSGGDIRLIIDKALSHNARRYLPLNTRYVVEYGRALPPGDYARPHQDCFQWRHTPEMDHAHDWDMMPFEDWTEGSGIYRETETRGKHEFILFERRITPSERRPGHVVWSDEYHQWFDREEVRKGRPWEYMSGATLSAGSTRTGI